MSALHNTSPNERCALNLLVCTTIHISNPFAIRYVYRGLMYQNYENFQNITLSIRLEMINVDPDNISLHKIAQCSI